jgi:DNA-binding NtrC family response regulator
MLSRQLKKRLRDHPLDSEPTIILCVDDEELPLTLRKLVLEKHGYEVITAQSATEAMRLIHSRPVGLVLTDQVMPGGSGTELARSIKEILPHLPVVLMSGINEIPPDVMYTDLFISKVEGPTALCAKLSVILSERRGSLD